MPKVTSYLSIRKQAVLFKEELSSFLVVKAGVPQGSVLGPLLFNIYINDLPDIVMALVVIFADDTCVVVEDDNFQSLSVQAAAVMGLVCEWFSSNGLVIHPGKTKILVFTPPRILPQIDLKVGGQEIETVPVDGCIKYLGIYIDPGLSWKNHIIHVKDKISKISFLINREKRNLPSKLKRTLYSTLIAPYFNYAAVCWSGATKATLNPIIKLQKRIVRMIDNKKFNSQTEPIFKRLRILPLEHQKHYADAVTGYKVWHKLAPGAIVEDFAKAPSLNTRSGSTNLFKVPLVRSSLLQKLPWYSVPNLWNIHYSDIPDVPLGEFQYNVKGTFLDILNFDE